MNRFRSAETRRARRLARIARWDRPLIGGWDRVRAWVNMLFVDHAVFRLLYLNRARVAPLLWRSAQPLPGDMKRFAALGVRTVFNLRGLRDNGSWQLEKDACDRIGMDLREFALHSRGAPDRETVSALCDAFLALQAPALIHCKSGADRAGFASALYLIVCEGRSVAEAKRQLALRYGHLKFSKTGILDAFFDLYRLQGEEKGLAFREWLDDVYDPQELTRLFKPGFWSDVLVDRVIHRE